MAKLIQMPHHSNCNCCGRQASFTELARRPSGFGPMKPSSSSSTPAAQQKRPNTHHGGTGGGIMKNQERKVSERVGSATQRRKSLQHGSESTPGTSAQKTLDGLSGDNLHNAEEIAAEIAEAVAQRSMLQATESRMKGTSRDKESLLEECLALKEALCDQLYHLQLHRVHHETVEGEQSKMEVAIQELEMAHGLQAPRTGDPSQLRARIKGLKCRQQEYYNVMTVQQDDIELLKKDTRVSFTKEAFVERDVFATETRRLQKQIRRLRVFYHKICTENNEVVRLRETITTLKSKISKIEMKIKNTKSVIVQMKKDIDQAKAESYEAQRNTTYAVSKAGELETHSLVLQRILTREKEEGNRIHKQTCALGEQIRIVKKENSDRAAQAALAAGMLAMDAQKGAGGKGGKKAGKVGKLKEFGKDDSASGTSKDLSAVRSSPSSPATPSLQSTVNKEFDEIRANYIKAIGKATDTFVETAPGSGSPRATPHPDIETAAGDHSGYEQLQTTFQKDVGHAEDKFMDMMDTLEYGAARPRRDLEAEARRLREQLEALQKQQMSISKFLESLTIELDNKPLKLGEYVVDVKDTQTSVKITSPDKTPEALARKKREAEEVARRAAEEEAKRKKAAYEEAARRAAEEEAKRKKAADEEAARRAAEEEARRKKAADEEAARRAAEEEAKRKKAADEEAARRAAEEEARRKKAAEDETARKKKEAEDEAARKKREAEEEAARKKKEAEENAKKGKGPAGAGPGAGAGAGAGPGPGAGAGAGDGKGKGKDEFFNEEMQGTIKENIKEVLSHLEVISKTVQQKATPSGTAETSAKDILKKLDEPK